MPTNSNPYDSPKPSEEQVVVGQQPGLFRIIGIILVATTSAVLAFCGTCLGLMVIVLPPISKLGTEFGALAFPLGLIASAAVAGLVGWFVRCVLMKEATMGISNTFKGSDNADLRNPEP